MNVLMLLWQSPHNKIGVVDAQWIIHQGIPSLGNQVSIDLTLRAEFFTLLTFH